MSVLLKQSIISNLHIIVDLIKSILFMWIICDVIKQNESQLANTDFEIKPIERINFLCFLFVSQNLQLLVSLELTNHQPTFMGFSA